MKKTIVLLACIFGISIVVSGQEREKKVLELKNGTTVTGFVMEQSDGNYMLETETGDILFYAKDEVRTVLDKEKKDADRERGMNYQGSDRLVKSGFSLTFSNSRLDLQPNQVSGRFWDEYTSAARKKKSGMVMMIIGGAVGNVIDRVRYEAVLDFLDFHYAQYHWPAFNVADIFICVGVGWYILNWLLARRRCMRVNKQ